ncbi:hypothetical protein QBC37DRAFT_24132 [Rhypophila decipiens]|uniref:Uncharacterized protein n=1 Tax=Rhypophila decipiens TaxID=261697 RepID=A0AAN7B9R6_9PEZI|nr:hypothetical protein QBC37DRAFT_24132 [Rhypophila decipiens]
MLDENLPTFRYKSSSDNPLSSILYFAQRGDEPSPEYLFKRPDPSLPASRDKYAAALCDAYNPDVVYAEVTVDPDWTQPTLSAAEIRAQSQSGAPPTVATAMIPDNFNIQLYNPDQSVTVKMLQGGWNKTDNWEFELPVQTFKLPSTSELDRDPGRGSPADLVPRIMFRWKKDGKLSRDMTCYMCGKNLGGRKNKEPDITIAFFKASRDSVVTIYEPNLHRVEVEDRKGLELVLLFGAEIIKDLYLNPKPDVFNVSGTAAVIATNGGKRKNSRPSGGTPPVAMSGALGTNNTTPGSRPSPTQASHSASAISSSAAAKPTQGLPGPSSAEIEAETRRLQAMVEREEREREKRERAEQKRIKKMLEEEEKEARRREAEIAKETERLRKKYGIEGQALPSQPAPAAGPAHNPPLPPRTNQSQMSPQFAPPPPHWGYQQNQNLAAPVLPPRPLSAGPGSGPGGGGGGGGSGSGRPFHSGILNSLWHGGGGNPPPPPHMNPPGGGGSRPHGRKVHRKKSM